MAYLSLIQKRMPGVLLKLYLRRRGRRRQGRRRRQCRRRRRRCLRQSTARSAMGKVITKIITRGNRSKAERGNPNARYSK
jgi:hypothetical protein